MFSLINVGERSGIGLCDVYNAWKASGYKEPEYVETVEPHRITLTLEIEVGDKATENVADAVSDVADVANDYELTELDKSVYPIYLLISKFRQKKLLMLYELQFAQSSVQSNDRKNHHSELAYNLRVTCGKLACLLRHFQKTFSFPDSNAPSRIIFAKKS